MGDAFHNSDTLRGAHLLPHAKSCALDGVLKLDRGGVLREVTVAYESYGRLNAARDNAVLICHALSGDSHVAKHNERDDPGWWDIMVGPGKPIDTDRYFVICPNILGGCRGTTGPTSINPETGAPLGREFPVITIGDIVEVQRRLIHRLGIDRLLAVVGGSLGGHMTLTWATRHAERVAAAVCVASSPRLTSQALAFDVVGRNAIRTDPENGLAIARMLGHITYLSREAMIRKFDPNRLEPRPVQTDFETRFAVGSYLAHQGDRFVERFDKDSYITLTTAMDLFDLGDSPATLAKSLAPARCRWLILSFNSDWLFPPFQSQQMVDALISMDKPISYCNVKSTCGHDAFLLPDDLPVYGEMIRGFLGHVSPHHSSTQTLTPTLSQSTGRGGSAPEHARDSIFHEQRLDYDSIIELIPPGASVLDLGCGQGGLLARLRDRGHTRLMGVELDQDKVLASLQRGLDLVQGDLNSGLSAFAEGQFDVVVLSQTLQTVTAVERVLRDMLRVGRQAIVSFPNLAFHRLRRMLADEGRAPRAGAWLGYNWYDTPNVRFLSIADFHEFCRMNSIRILRQIALNTEEHREVIAGDDPNRNADVAVVVIGR